LRLRQGGAFHQALARYMAFAARLAAARAGVNVAALLTPLPSPPGAGVRA